MDFLPNLKTKLSKDKVTLGLDFGTQEIKAVKLKFAQEQAEFCGFEIEPNKLDPVQALRKIKESFAEDLVNISFSGTSTVIRYIEFPRMKSEELKQALKFEAQKHIPFSLEEVNLDACIINQGLPNNKMLVLVAAVKKELAHQRIKLIEQSGFRVNNVNIDSVALINAFNFINKENEGLKGKALALLNIGASLSNLNILEAAIPRLSRDIHFAGNKFTQRIEDNFGIDFKSAEELKINPEKDKGKFNQLALVIEPVYSNLAGAIRTSFDFYESQNASSVGKILLSGGGSKFLGLKDTLKTLLGVEVDYWDPIGKIKFSADADQEKIKQSSTQLPVALGLALSQ